MRYCIPLLLKSILLRLLETVRFNAGPSRHSLVVPGGGKGGRGDRIGGDNLVEYSKTVIVYG